MAQIQVGWIPEEASALGKGQEFTVKEMKFIYTNYRTALKLLEL